MIPKKKLAEFVEIEFAMPFYEIYYPTLDYDCAKAPLELKELCEFLSIKIDTKSLFTEYEDTKIEEGNIHFYFSNSDNNIFLFFDLHKDKYDQMEMIIIGARIKTINLKKAKEILHKLYFKSTTRSSIKEDYFNQNRWRLVNNRIPNNNRNIKKYNIGYD